MKRMLASFVLGLCLIALHGHGLAQTDSTDSARIDFESTDRNNDGYITRDEFPADHPLLIRFESLDRNGDERLSPDELDDFS